MRQASGDRFVLSEEGHLDAALQDAATSGFRVILLRLLAYGVGFLASVAISRALGPEGRGLYAFPGAVLGIAVTLSHLGLHQGNVFLATRGVSIDVLWRNATVVALGISGFVWVILGTIFLAVGPTLGGLPLIWFAVPLLQIPFLLQTIYWTNLLQLKGQVTGAAMAAFGGAAVHAILVLILFVSDDLTPFRVLGLTWAANGTTWLLVLLLGKRGGVMVGVGLDRSLMWQALRFGLKTYLGAILFLLLLRADELLVKGLVGYRALGLYSLAVTLAELLWLLTDPLAAALLRHQVLAMKGDERRLGYAMARLSLLVACLGGTIAWIIAPHLIGLIYGEVFAEATWLFRFLIPGIVAIAIQRPLAAIVVKDGRPWTITSIAGAVFLLNLVLNLALLPMVGVIAASVASSLCYLLLCLAYVIATQRRGVVDWHDLIPRTSDVRLLVRALVPFPNSSVRGSR